MLAAILFAATTTVPTPRLTDRDREIIRTVAVEEFHDTGAGGNPDDHSLIDAWTVRISDEKISSYDDSETMNHALYPLYSRLPEYKAIVERAKTRYYIGRIQSAFVRTAMAPRLCCDPNGEPSPGSAYEGILTFSPPGYSKDGQTAMVYVHAKDCLSTWIALYHLVRDKGGWRIDKEWELLSEGE